MPDTVDAPSVTIVIPVYNEEAILRTAVVDLIDRLVDAPWTYEIVLAENGSTDRTRDIAAKLGERFPQLTTRHTETPNYGRALRDGILHANGRFVMCDEIDLCDTDFQARAWTLLNESDVDFVVGSKAMKGAEDRRPWMRRLGTRAVNGLLKVTLGFQGTDTHGLKAFRADRIQPLAEACQVDRDLFASELVIRAERAGLDVREIPVRVQERRPPSVGLLRRVPNVLSNLTKLFIAIRIKR